jgi:16S rRNA processing protein RimM
MTKEECFNLGYISKTVGNKGELLLIFDVDDVKRYQKLETVFVEINKQLVPFFISALELRGNGAKVSFEGINTTEKAEEITRTSLYLPLTSLPALKGKKFYFHEVLGFTAIDKAYGNIGTVENILDYPTQALFQIKRDKTEILIPVKDDFIESIDRMGKTIHLNAPEGLIDIYLNPQHDAEE